MMANDAKKRCGGKTIAADEFLFYKAMNAKGWTQGDLADATGLTPLVCSHMANGRPVYKRHFYLACVALGVQPEQLLDRHAAAEPAEPPKGYRYAKETKTAALSLNVCPWVKEDLRQAAERRGLSMNELANTIIIEFLKEETK